MKNLLLTLIIALTASISTSAIEIDTLWMRFTAGINELDFTPDDKYVIAWTNGIEFWEVQQGVKEYFIPTETLGDFNYNEEFLVFAQDSTPKLLNWQTREVVQGFEKQNAFIGRIKTAKSKNEFMASKGDHPKVIYFWDINQKQILDSFEIMKEFEKNGQKWGRSIHEYNYIGTNDEYFYIRINDNNALTPNLPTKNEIDNFSYLIYNRETKELVDSLFSFQITTDNYNHVDKLVVMNDRNNVAWNNKGGEINFYDILNKRFFGKFTRNDFSKVNDIEFTKDLPLMCLTYGEFINVFDFNTRSLFASFNTGSSYGQCKLSENLHYMIGSVGGVLLMHPTSITSIEEFEHQNSLSLSPNPAINTITIEFQSIVGSNFKLSLIDMIGNEIDLIDSGNLSSQIYTKDYNISNIAYGTYFIRLEFGENIITKQFIKE